MSAVRRWCESATFHLGGCYPSRVVLDEVGGYHPFVTHIEVLPPDLPPFKVTGHYFESLEDAVADFGLRALRDIRPERERTAA